MECFEQNLRSISIPKQIISGHKWVKKLISNYKDKNMIGQKASALLLRILSGCESLIEKDFDNVFKILMGYKIVRFKNKNGENTLIMVNFNIFAVYSIYTIE